MNLKFLRIPILIEKIGRRICIRLRSLLIAVTILLLTVFILAQSYISYQSAKQILIRNLESINESKLKQVNNKLDYSVVEIEKVIRKLSSNENLLSYMDNYRKSQNSTYDRMVAESEIKRIFLEVKIIYPNIKSIDLYMDNGFVTSNEYLTDLPKFIYEDITTSENYALIKSSDKGIAVCGTKNVTRTSDTVYDNIVFSTLLMKGRQETGILSFVMQSNWTDTLFGDSSNIILMDGKTDGLVWASTPEAKSVYRSFKDDILEEKAAPQNKIGKGKYTVLSGKVAYGNWIIAIYSQIPLMSEYMSRVRTSAAISIILSLAIGIILAFPTSERIIKPAHNLIGMVKKYKNGSRTDYVSPANIKLNIRDNLLLFFTSILIISIIISSFTLYYTLSNAVDKSIIHTIDQAFKQTSDNIDYFVELNERVYLNIALDVNVQEYLTSRNGQDFNQTPRMYEIYRKLSNIIDENMMLGQNIFETCLYDVNGNPVFSSSFQSQDRLDENILKILDNPSHSFFYAQYGKDKYGRNLIKLVRKINGKMDSGNNSSLERIGYISMNYDELNLEELFRSMSTEDSRIYLVEQGGTIISHRDKSQIGNIYLGGSLFLRLNGKDHDTWTDEINLTICYGCTNIPWMLVGEIPYKDITRDNGKILTVNLYAFIVCILLIVFLSHIISNTITKSMLKLSSQLFRFDGSSMGLNFDYESSISEIQELGSVFNNMAIRINELIEKVYLSQIKEKTLENEKKEAELFALQSQINPHFLYNTLEAIMWLIDEDKKRAADMIMSLANFFDNMIRDAGQYISIEKELDYTRSYIKMQKLRLGNKLEIIWSINEDLMSYKMPKMILQPILENAIHHGIQEKEGTGHIKVQCYEEDERIFFRIEDDGVGIKQEYIHEINMTLAEKQYPKNLGLYNVNKRLQLYFDTDCRLHISSLEDFNTIVSFSLPKVKDENLQK